MLATISCARCSLISPAAMQRPRHFLDRRALRSGAHREVARVQGHVALLDADGPERAERGHVLRQAHRRHHAGELLRGRVPHHAFSSTGMSGLAFTAPPTVPTWSGISMLADQGAFVHRQRRQRLVAPVRARAKACAPASIARQSLPVAMRHRVDAVHHALVVRAGAVRDRPRRSATPSAMPCATSAPVNPKSASASKGMRQLARARRRSARFERMRSRTRPAGDPLDQRRHALAHRVDQVGAHRVLRVDDEVDDQLLFGADFQDARRHVLRAAAARLHRGVQRVRRVRWIACFSRSTAERAASGLGISLICTWPIIRGSSALAVKPPPSARNLCRQRDRRDHRRLLHRHRDQHVLAVDLEVEPDTHRQAEHADGVLDHRVGVREGQRPALSQALHLVGGSSERLGQPPQPFRHLHLVEARQPA